ncbi:MAG: THUMP domain-containing protein, partial [Pseudodesulfovibrio sp.]
MSVFDRSATILVTCPKEMPECLADELATLGLPDIHPLEAGVETRGVLADCMRLNLWVRTGHRVLFELARMDAQGPDDLYRAV